MAVCVCVRVEIIASPLRYRLPGFDYVRGRRVLRHQLLPQNQKKSGEGGRKKKKKRRKSKKEKSAGGLLGNEAFVLGTLPTPLLLEKHITVRGQGEK